MRKLYLQFNQSQLATQERKWIALLKVAMGSVRWHGLVIKRQSFIAEADIMSNYLHPEELGGGKCSEDQTPVTSQPDAVDQSALVEWKDAQHPPIMRQATFLNSVD